MRNNIDVDYFSITHVSVRSIPANLKDSLSYTHNIDHDFSIIGFNFPKMLTSATLNVDGIQEYDHPTRIREEGNGGVSLCISEKKVMDTEL